LVACGRCGFLNPKRKSSLKKKKRDAKRIKYSAKPHYWKIVLYEKKEEKRKGAACRNTKGNGRTDGNGHGKSYCFEKTD
jgi:hypothetical protein